MLDFFGVFISTENTRDPRTANILGKLSEYSNLMIEHSPMNPIYGLDSRWTVWYEKGCGEAINHTDHF